MFTLVQYLINSKFGSTELDGSIYDYLYAGEEVPEGEQEKFFDLVYCGAHENIRALDNRLYWEPEISTVYWECEDDSEDEPEVSEDDITEAIDDAFRAAIRKMGW